MKRLSALLIRTFAFAFLCCVGCTDHDVPSNPGGQIALSTVDAELNYKAESFYIFGAKLDAFGNQAIKEIGVVYSLKLANNANFHAMPTVGDTKVMIGTNPDELRTYKTGHNLPVSSFEKMYYRAYAILMDDSVVYGSVMEYLWYDTAVVEIQSPITVNGFFFARLNITDLGALPITEYGVVYTYSNNPYESLTELPLISDNKLRFDEPFALGFHSKIMPIPKPEHINVRSYVIYQNGMIEYGKASGGF